jgi:hypothetical protein
MPDVRLDAADAADAAELAEMLQLLTGWLVRDPARLAASPEQFVGHPAYGVGLLRDDLQRFVFLLGGRRASLRPMTGDRSSAPAGCCLAEGNHGQPLLAPPPQPVHRIPAQQQAADCWYEPAAAPASDRHDRQESQIASRRSPPRTAGPAPAGAGPGDDGHENLNVRWQPGLSGLGPRAQVAGVRLGRGTTGGSLCSRLQHGEGNWCPVGDRVQPSVLRSRALVCAALLMINLAGWGRGFPGGQDGSTFSAGKPGTDCR